MAEVSNRERKRNIFFPFFIFLGFVFYVGILGLPHFAYIPLGTTVEKDDLLSPPFSPTPSHIFISLSPCWQETHTLFLNPFL